MMKIRSLALTILAFVLVLALTGGGAHAEQNAAAASSSIMEVEEFADTHHADAGPEYELFERYLQTTETTTCNFWCQLKNSLGLTIVGLILICLR